NESSPGTERQTHVLSLQQEDATHEITSAIRFGIFGRPVQIQTNNYAPPTPQHRNNNTPIRSYNDYENQQQHWQKTTTKRGSSELQHAVRFAMPCESTRIETVPWSVQP